MNNSKLRESGTPSGVYTTIVYMALEGDIKGAFDNYMNYRKNLLGSAASGSLGFNAHFANIIAAMFIATGQDAAHVVDGSLGFTIVEKVHSGINFSVTLPDIQVGTIGGGTGLPTQKECLALMGVAGTGKHNSKILAEIVASAVLAGEISLLGALCTKDLANAHEKLNR